MGDYCHKACAEQTGARTINMLLYGAMRRTDEAFGSKISAQVYDLQYPGKDYLGDASEVARLAELHCAPGQRSILNVACGTGRHLEYLSQSFEDVWGMDISDEQLAQAHSRLSGSATLFQGDMLDFDLHRQFDVAACLFGDIQYLDTPEKMLAGVKNITRHVRPGGLLIVERGYTPEEYTSLGMGGGIRWLKIEGGEESHISISRMAVMGPLPPEGEGTVGFTLDFQVGLDDEGGQRIVNFREEHSVGFYREQTYWQAMRSAIPDSEIQRQDPMPGDPYGKPWFIGRVATRSAS
jgi:SAM-dependent methyltransferase